MEETVRLAPETNPVNYHAAPLWCVEIVTTWSVSLEQHANKL